METINIKVKATINGSQVEAEVENPTSKEFIQEAIHEQYIENCEGTDEESPEDVDVDEIQFEVVDWGEVEEYENLCNIETLCEVCDTNPDNDLEIISAGIEADISIENIDEAYSGSFRSDEDFVEDLLESTGDLPKDLPAYIHIDWKSTSRDIMMDYSEAKGHYFRCF